MVVDEEDIGGLAAADTAVVLAIFWSAALARTISDPSYPGWGAPVPMVPPTAGQTTSMGSLMACCWLAGAGASSAWKPGALAGSRRAAVTAAKAWLTAANARMTAELLGAVLAHRPADIVDVAGQLSALLAVMVLWRVALAQLVS